MGGWVNLLNRRSSVCSPGITVCSFSGILLSERFVNASSAIFDLTPVISESASNIARVKLLSSDKALKLARL